MKGSPWLRWLLATACVISGWLVLAPTWTQRRTVAQDLLTPDSRVVHSLENTTYRYDFLDKGTSPPECPGQNCPLDPSNDPKLLTKEAKPFGNILNATTKDGWHGTMYIRWDLLTPDFIRHPNDKIAFDFYGIAGKSYRFFVDGVPVAAENGGTSQRAIIFSPNKPAGSPLSLGFEIAVGR